MGAEMSLMEPTVMEVAVTPGVEEDAAAAVAVPEPRANAPAPMVNARPEVSTHRLFDFSMTPMPPLRYRARASRGPRLASSTLVFPTAPPFSCSIPVFDLRRTFRPDLTRSQIPGGLYFRTISSGRHIHYGGMTGLGGGSGPGGLEEVSDGGRRGLAPQGGEHVERVLG